MRQRLLVLVGSIGLDGLLRGRVLLASLALLVTGCAGHSLMPREQALAIKSQERALEPHAGAIQTAIRQSGNAGALAFIDAKDGRLVVLPGETPADAWARDATSPDDEASRLSAPAVMTFVHRADVPKAPETVTLSDLQRQQAVRVSLAALEADVRDAHRRTEERLAMIQRELTESVAAAKQEKDRAVAAARADMQHALSSLADELATARKSMLQTAELGRLNHQLNVENASGIQKVATASQELTAASARLAHAMQQLSESLASQLKELAGRLDAIQSKVADIK